MFEQALEEMLDFREFALYRHGEFGFGGFFPADFAEFLAGAGRAEFFVLDKIFQPDDHFEVFLGVGAFAGLVLGWAQFCEQTFPITQYVRLYIRDFTHFTDTVIKLFHDGLFPSNFCNFRNRNILRVAPIFKPLFTHLSHNAEPYSATPGASPVELSVVVPLLNEAESLTELTDAIASALGGQFEFEIIFVDDGSSDDSWEVIRNLSEMHSYIRGIRFRRNYGKSYALQRGFEHVRGAIVATLDADLQDDPAELPEMVKMLDEANLDLVSGWKKVRFDPLSKTVPSRFFNKVTAAITGIRLNDFNSGIKVYRREVTDSLELYGEMHRYIPVLARWEGFSRIGEKVVKHHPRKYGTTKYGMSRFVNGFLDLVTLVFIQVYFQRPMHFFGTMGVGFLAVGSLITAYLVVMRLFFEQYLSNRPLLLFGILLLVLGLQFFSVGFLGEMLNKGRNRRRTINIRETL